MRRNVVVALIALGAAAGCAAGAGSRAAAAPDEQLAAVPGPVLRRCAALAPRRSIAVLCPTRLPKATWFVRYSSLAHGRDEYLTDLRTRPAGSGAAFHVLAGGRRGRFPLATTANGEWPVDVPAPSPTCCARPHDLGLVGARQGAQPGTWQPVRLVVRRRASVARHPALVMTVAGDPDGGVHGGHLAVVWNQGRSGYVLSVHFADDGMTSEDQETVLLRAARAMSRFAFTRLG